MTLRSPETTRENQSLLLVSHVLSTAKRLPHFSDPIYLAKGLPIPRYRFFTVGPSPPAPPSFF